MWQPSRALVALFAAWSSTSLLLCTLFYILYPPHYQQIAILLSLSIPFLSSLRVPLSFFFLCPSPLRPLVVGAWRSRVASRRHRSFHVPESVVSPYLRDYWPEFFGSFALLSVSISASQFLPSTFRVSVYSLKRGSLLFSPISPRLPPPLRLSLSTLSNVYLYFFVFPSPTRLASRSFYLSISLPRSFHSST